MRSNIIYRTTLDKYIKLNLQTDFNQKKDFIIKYTNDTNKINTTINKLKNYIDIINKKHKNTFIKKYKSPV